MDKHTYCFILGLNHSLSKVEVINVLTKKNINFELVECSQEVLLIETVVDLHTFNIENFGGVVKFVEIVGKVTLEQFFADDEDFFSSIDVTLLNPTEAKKLTFGLSVYGAGCRFKDLNTSWYLAPKLCNWLRNTYNLLGTRASFLPLIDRRLSTVAVDKNKLVTKGFELCLCAGKENMYIGKTLSVQDYKSYGFRDFGRPERDARSGMIPPKLAKILINLANQDKSATLYDPFCGSGTMLEEMMLLGFHTVYGSDRSDRAVQDSQENLDWLFDHYENLKKDTFKINLFTSDVKECAQKVASETVDAIVTEPFLGSENARYFNKVQAAQEIHQLQELYLAAFEQFRTILRPNGTVVIIFPVFKVHQDFYYLNILDSLKKSGWMQQGYLPGRFDTDEDRKILSLSLTERGSIVFFRSDQTVSREIMVFKRTAE